MSDQTDAHTNLMNYRKKRPHNISFKLTQLSPQRSYCLEYHPDDGTDDIWHLYFTAEEIIDLWNLIHMDINSLATSGAFAERRTGGPF